MKAQYVKELDDELRNALGLPPNAGYPLEVGKQYAVFGLTIAGDRVWLAIEQEEEERVLMAPLDLFEILDRRVSNTWEFFVHDGGTILIEPPGLSTIGFVEDLYDGEPSAREAFRRMKSLMAPERAGKDDDQSL